MQTLKTLVFNLDRDMFQSRGKDADFLLQLLLDTIIWALFQLL